MPYGVLTGRRVAVWIGILLAVVAVLSTIVGFAASGPEFNWEVASIFGTAVGTTALAGFTGALAYTTSGDVRATWELATTTREQLAVQERPLLLRKRAWFDGNAAGGHLRIILANVGLGPALKVEVVAYYAFSGKPDLVGMATVAAIRPGEDSELRVPFSFREPQPGNVTVEHFEIRGTYVDRSRENTYNVVTDWGSAE